MDRPLTHRPAPSRMKYLSLSTWLILLVVIFNQATPVQSQVCRTRADVVFLLDASGSISMAETDFNWRTVLGFVEGIVNDLPIDTGDMRVALVRFSQEADVMWNLARYNNRNDLVRATRSLTSVGERTNIASAFEAARNQILVPFGGDRDGVPNIVFLITDGQPTVRETETVQQANLLKSIATLVTVGITTEVSLRDLLQRLASNPQQAYFSNVYSQLTALSSNVLQESCRQQIGPVPSPPPGPAQECQAVADVAFLVDTSGSITEETQANWDLLKDFVLQVIRRFNVGQQATHVGVVEFSQTANVVFYLDRYFNERDLEIAVNGLPYQGQTTNILEPLSWHGRSYSKRLPTADQKYEETGRM